MTDRRPGSIRDHLLDAYVLAAHSRGSPPSQPRAIQIATELRRMGWEDATAVQVRALASLEGIELAPESVPPPGTP